MLKIRVREEEGKIWRRGVTTDGLPVNQETDGKRDGRRVRGWNKWKNRMPEDEVNKREE